MLSIYSRPQAGLTSKILRSTYFDPIALGHAYILMRFIVWLCRLYILISFGAALWVPVLFHVNKPLKHFRFVWSPKFSIPIHSTGLKRMVSGDNFAETGSVKRQSTRVDLPLIKNGRRASDITSLFALFHDPNTEDLSYLVTTGLKFKDKAVVRTFWKDFIAQDYRMAERLDTQALTTGMFHLIRYSNNSPIG